MTTTSMQFGQSAINVVLNEGQLPARITTDANGNTVLVGADGTPIPGIAGSVSAITYNSDGTVNTYIKNGATYTVSYNSNGFVSSISGTDGVSFTPTYDNNFRVTGMVVA